MNLIHLYVFVLCICTIFANSQRTNDNSSLYRLPNNVFPESYKILLLTNVTRANFTYEGQVSIELSVVERTNRIVLHAYKTLGLFTEKSRLVQVFGEKEIKTLKLHNQHYEEETQFYIIELLETLLPKNKYLLRLFFVGEVVDDVFGFYRSSYRVANSEIRWLGVTQFSSTFARRAFPCMDEPGFKATFQLSVGHYKNETVTSNTLPESTIDKSNYYQITTFSKTPRMSTYLLGWAIHDFDQINSSDRRICLWTRLPRQASWDSAPALVEGPKLYKSLETFMDLPNPIEKIDHFSVPDFHFSAMENWGLVTFRESVTLVTYESTASKDIHNNLIIMAHEYAHTWFGNIVTMDFWDHAWLKEGFATYFAYMSLAMIDREPNIIMEDIFTIENVHTSMIDDSVKHSRTMNGRGVGSPKSCLAAMDFVTYKKAASVIRMFVEVVGEKAFKEAMRSYLRDKQYSSAIPADIYRHLKSATEFQTLDNKNNNFIPVNIDEFIESWANQANYPLVRAFRTKNDTLVLSQQVFQFNSQVNSNESRFWWIPLTVTTGNYVFQSWLSSKLTRQIQLPPSTDWYLVNHRQNGYYRVDYDEDNWSALQRFLDSENFHQLKSVDRAGIINDAFNLARAGIRDYKLPLELSLYLRRENEYAPWVAASRALRLIDDKLRDRTHVRFAFRRYVLELIAPIYKKLTFEILPNETRIKRMHRSVILFGACSFEFADCVSSAKTIFDHWIVDEHKVIPADLKAVVYRVGIVNGSSDQWIALRQRFFQTELHSEWVPMMHALASSENPAFLNELLELAIKSDTGVAKQYRRSIIQSIVSGSSQNIETVLKYLQSNSTDIMRLRGVNFLADILSAIGEEISSTEQNDKLIQFVETNASILGMALEVGKKAIQSASNNIAWINTCAAQISKYLNSKFRHELRKNI